MFALGICKYFILGLRALIVVVVCVIDYTPCVVNNTNYVKGLVSEALVRVSEHATLSMYVQHEFFYLIYYCPK